MPETEISLDQLPAEAHAAFGAAPAEKEIDPLALDSDTLFQLTNQKAFDPVQFAQANPDRATDPATVAKLADVHARVKEQGFRLQDLPSLGQAVKSVGQAIVGGAKQAWNYLNVFSEPIASIAGMISGQGPEFQAELAKQNEQRLIENLAGTEQSVTGLSQLPGKALGKLGQATGLAKPYTQQSQEDKNKDFFDALGKAQTAQEISKGKGGLLGNVASETVKELEARGEAPRPQEVELLAGGDPLAFLTFSKAFGVAGTVAGKVLPTATGAVEAGLGKAAAAVGGRGVQAVGKTVELGGAGVNLAGKAAPLAGGVSGLVKGSAFGSPVSGTIAGLAAGRWAGKVLKSTAQSVSRAGEGISQFGKEVATGVGTTPWSQAARDVLQATPGLAADVAKGAGFDIGLAAATSESPQETEAASAFGTIFGGLHGVARAGSKVVQGQIVLPRQWGIEAKTPAYGNFKTFDSLHSQSETSAPPGQILRANSIRQFLKGAGGDAEAFLMPSAAAMEAALVERGLTPAAAKEASQQQGMFTGDLLDDAGNKRRVVLLNNADVAPHESMHVLQDVLGESANQTIDNLVYQEYAPQWEQLGQKYADRLGGTGDWREVVLDKSGWGSAAAAEKALRDSANKIRNETGAEPKAEDAQALAQGILTQARENGAGWRDILTPEEAAQEANKYIARELAAENFDAAFKHTGPGLKDGNSLPEKLARIVAKTASWLGAEPLAGAKTDILGVEPKFKVVTGVKELARSQQVQVEPAPAKSSAKSAPGAIFTPEQRAAEGSKAERMAGELSARNPAQAEVLRKIASAISGGNGLRVDYRAAPGEPGGSPNMSREARRAVIESFREMPEEVRPLWEKLNFPDRVEATKNRGFQILGWSPENFAANAQKTAKFIADVFDKGQTIDMPYEVDPATKSFTPDAWKQIYEDTQVFVANQAAGGTGSGKPLTLPADAAAMRITVPPLREAALAPLDQTKADFINVLFNVMLPETPRVSRAGGTPGNIVAQRIAKANEAIVGPRVVEPGRVRSTAEFKGFAGERIQEVNPLRARMEKAASDAGVSFPSLIETNQRLNLDHIADVTPAPEAPVIRGVTDTLRAGFAPAAEKTVEKLGRDIASMDVATFKAASEQWNGGMTGEAQRIGKLASRPEDLASLQRLATEAQQRMNDAKKARDMDAVFAELAKKQFFDEAAQAASGREFTTEAPTGQFAPKASEEIRDVAKKYADEAGIPYAPAQTYRTLNPELGKRLADFYENAKSDPTDPAVETSYRALADETLRQYEVIKDAGYAIEPWNGEGEPYKNSAAAIADIRDNKHLYFLKTENAYGKEGTSTLGDTPMLTDSGITIDGQRLLVNDVFRAVHDFFGHGKEGFEFGPRGEFNAWAAHSEMYSPEAQGALAAETLAQNSFVNFGKHLRNEAGNIPAKGEPGYKSATERPFAEQKNIVVPQKLIDEARGQFAPKVQLKAEDKGKFAENAGFGNYWMSPDGKFYSVADHGRWAKERLQYPEGETPAKKSYEAEQAMVDAGWVRISREREGGGRPTVFLNGKSLNTKQESAIEMWATENPGVEIVDTKRLRRMGDDRAQFAPKKKDEAKLLPAGADGMSKAWILPSGKIEQLGAQWHHAFLSDNPEIAKKYNLTVPPFEGNDVAGVREAALKKGFVRVNYGRNTGTLTVEARQKDWRHQKAAVEKLVEKNLDDIDNMTVHLLDETASKAVDSDSERLFRHDTDQEKLANLPFITKEGGDVRGAQFSPGGEKPLSSEEFGKELSKIRAGQSGGQTFNSDGTVWAAPKEPVDVVTLASVNIPLGSAKPETVREALAQYEDLLNQPGIVAGVFAFSKDGKPTMSADINAVVPQEFRDNSFAFVKDNDQVSFWDAVKNEEVKTGGKGNTKLTTVDQLLTAQEALLKGEPVDVAELAGAGIGETQGLPGMEMGREFNQKAISQMSQAEIRKHFPEALVPRNSAEEIPYDIVESPLFKAAGSQEAAVKSFGRKLVEFYRENERSPELKAGEKWYSEFTPLLKKTFGKDAQIFAELLAATSPNTEPGVNFQFAFDALSNWKAGKYDKMIPKFNEGFERLADGSLQKIYERDVAAGKVKNAPAKPSEATYLAHWILKNDLIPISSSGKRFGMHSEAVLKVLSRRWLSQTTGPKTQNFVKNLVGTGHDATVDVWAARTMRRLGYAGSKERWRILPANSKGVGDVDFAFSQEAFREAAKEIGIKADALQGALWFAEKKLWSDNGWGRLSLGDFRAEIEKVPALRKEFARKNLVEPKKKVAQMSLLDDLVRKK